MPEMIKYLYIGDPKNVTPCKNFVKVGSVTVCKHVPSFICPGRICGRCCFGITAANRNIHPIDFIEVLGLLREVDPKYHIYPILPEVKK